MRKPRAFRPDAFDDQLENRRVLSHIAAHIPAHYNNLNLHGVGNARLAAMTSHRLNLSAMEHPTANAVGAAASFTSRIVSSPKNLSPGGTTPLSTLTSLLPPAGTLVSTSNTTTTGGTTLPNTTTFLPATGTFVSTGSTGTTLPNTTAFLPATGTFVSTGSPGTTLPTPTTFLPATGTFASIGATIPVITTPTTTVTPSTPMSLTGASTTASANSTAPNPAVTTFLNGLDTTLNNSATMIA